MDEQNSNKYSYPPNFSNSSDSHSNENSRNLFALIDGDSLEMRPYRSKFEIKSIGSGMSRQSRDSDLLNRLCEGEDQSKSSKSLSRNMNNSQKNLRNRNLFASSNSNSMISEQSQGKRQDQKASGFKQPPKIHNCVCFVAGQCLSYNCNCFLSPFPCTPECCPNCINLKSNLPQKASITCSCKKTKCLKLYCECLSKGQFCSVMCRCELCQNHQHSATRIQTISSLNLHRGCSCQKSRCIKKYCECYSRGLKCTNKCACIGCKNFITTEIQQEKTDYKKEQKKNKQSEQMIPELEFQEIDFYSGRRLG